MGFNYNNYLKVENAEFTTGSVLAKQGWGIYTFKEVKESSKGEGIVFSFTGTDTSNVITYVSYDDLNNLRALNDAFGVVWRGGEITNALYQGRQIELFIIHEDRKNYKMITKDQFTGDEQVNWFNSLKAFTKANEMNPKYISFMKANNADVLDDALWKKLAPGNDVIDKTDARVTKIAMVGTNVQKTVQSEQPQNNQPLDPNNFANRDEYNRAVQEQMNQLTGQEMSNFSLDDSVPF